MYAPAQPYPGIPVKPANMIPQPGMVVTSYQIVEPEVGCCKCNTLSTSGLIGIIVLVLVFWPLAWIPCVCADCHQKQQMPVYGFPAGGAPPPMPYAQPQYAGPPPPAPGMPVKTVV